MISLSWSVRYVTHYHTQDNIPFRWSRKYKNNYDMPDDFNSLQYTNDINIYILLLNIL